MNELERIEFLEKAMHLYEELLSMGEEEPVLSWRQDLAIVITQELGMLKA